MAKLIYIANVSLDGYVDDAHGGFEWTAPKEAPMSGQYVGIDLQSSPLGDRAQERGG